MMIVCPTCGTLHELPHWLAASIDDVATRQMIGRALRSPPELAAAIIAYVSLFSPPARRLRPTRLRSLLGELLDMIESGRIERRGRTYPAPVPAWRQAFEDMQGAREAGKLVLPLRSHGYLLEIVAGLADRAEAAEERTRETDRRHDVLRRAPAPEPEHVMRSMPDEVRSALAKYTRGRRRVDTEETDADQT